MLQNLSNPQVQELQFAVFFLQNSALLYWSLVVCAHLNQHVPNQWTGCSGPTSYLARSLGITSCGFFIHVHKSLCVPNCSGWQQRVVVQKWSCCYIRWRWYVAKYEVGIWISFQCCMCNKQRPSWMCLTLSWAVGSMLPTWRKLLLRPRKASIPLPTYNAI